MDRGLGRWMKFIWSCYCDGMHFVNIYDMPGSPDSILYWFYLVVKEIKIKIHAKFKIHSSISHPHAVPNLYDVKMNSYDLIITNHIGCYMSCDFMSLHHDMHY